MNKKEISEIRRQFHPDRCSITRICGCYVDHEKEKKLEFKNAFLSLPEEEEFKYFDIFKQTLSGTLGKHLIHFDFPLEQEMPGGTQQFLLKLRDSRLTDDALITEFYDKIIEHLAYAENYYIILIHAAYDVPGKSTDGLEMFDASDEVYEHILCSICPVNMSKASLAYNAEHNSIEDRIRDWVVDPPMKGFLFPVFNDRSSDIHSVLYYSKNPEDEQPGLIENVFGAAPGLTPKNQKIAFQTIVEETLGEDAEYEMMRNIHDNLNEMIEETKENPAPLILDSSDVKHLLEESGVPEKNLEIFDKTYEAVAGEKATLVAANVTNARKFQVETPDILVKVNPERADLIETRIIDGRRCLVIAIDDHLEVNGMSVHMINDSCEE